jgi:uncharacterized membrane protein required for colicin V production
MMELSFFLRLCILFFGVMGYLRGFYKEFVGTAGIVLTLFVLVEFGWLVDFVTGNWSAVLRFYIDAIFLIAMTFFSYQQAPVVFVPRGYRTQRGTIRIPGADNWQERILGAVFGAINGYLVVGSLWYMMDQLEYPLDSLFIQPVVGSPSANFVDKLPLALLQQGDVLVVIVAILFIIIMVFR